jgi:hypothetical protein
VSYCHHFSSVTPLFSIFSLVAILVGSWDHRTHFLRGATKGPFHKSLVAIGPVVSEEELYFDEIVIGWFSSKNVFGGSAH